MTTTLATTRPFPVERARQVRLLALDVDGVLTDGGIFLLDQGGEAKRFYVRDGLGLRMLAMSGLLVGVITARHSQLVARRGQELGLAFVHQGILDKWSCLSEEMQRHQLNPAQCGYMGDDLVDLPVLGRVGLATAPGDAHDEVAARVHWQSPHPGGWGAVRDLAERLLQAQDRWEETMARFLP